MIHKHSKSHQCGKHLEKGNKQDPQCQKGHSKMPSLYYIHFAEQRDGDVHKTHILYITLQIDILTFLQNKVAFIIMYHVVEQTITVQVFCD